MASLLTLETASAWMLNHLRRNQVCSYCILCYCFMERDVQSSLPSVALFGLYLLENSVGKKSASMARSQLPQLYLIISLTVYNGALTISLDRIVCDLRMVLPCSLLIFISLVYSNICRFPKGQHGGLSRGFPMVRRNKSKRRSIREVKKITSNSITNETQQFQLSNTWEKLVQHRLDLNLCAGRARRSSGSLFQAVANWNRNPGIKLEPARGGRITNVGRRGLCDLQNPKRSSTWKKEWNKWWK